METTTVQLEEILVFKTNIHTQDQLIKLDRLFRNPNIIHWNVDMDDCDKVLRVVTDKLSIDDVLCLARTTGIVCEELK